MLSFKLTALSSLTLSWLASAMPAGGPQGTVTYPLGTILQIAVLQPSGNDYLASNYTIDPSNEVAYIKTDSSDAGPVLSFITINATDSAGYTGVAMQAPGYGLELTDSGMTVSQNASMDKFYLETGTLRNLEAPEGFFYCDADSPSLGQHDVGRVSFVIGDSAPEDCYEAAFVTIY